MDSSTPTSLVGRSTEISAIERAVNDAIDGKGSVLTFTGEPGIGKTTLARLASELFTEKGGFAFWGRSTESNQSLPFDPWIDILRSVTSAKRDDPSNTQPNLSRLLASTAAQIAGSQTDRPEDHHQLFREIDALLRDVARTQPVCIVLDDLQWADESGMKLFEYATRGCADSAILLIGTYRETILSLSHPLSRTIGNLIPESHFQQIKPQRLTAEESMSVWINSSDTTATPSSDLIEAAQGNPLFVVELARSTQNSLSLHQTNLTTSISIQEVVSRHLGSLSDSSVDILKTCALLDADWALSDAAILFTDPATALEAWDEAEKVGLIEPTSGESGRLQFWHPLIREVLVADMTAVDLAVRHSQIAQALEPSHANLPVRSHVLARHFAAAVPVLGKDSAIHYLTIAGDHSLDVSAFDSAHAAFGKILELVEGREHDDVWANAAAGFARSGLYAVAGPRRSVIVEPLKGAFDYYVDNGQLDNAISLATLPYAGEASIRQVMHDIALRSLEFVDDAHPLSGRIIANVGIVHYYLTGEFDTASDYLDQALTIADNTGDDHLRSLVLKNIVNIRHFHNADDEFELDLIGKAVAAARKIGDYISEAETTRAGAMTALMQGKASAAVRYADECLVAAETSRNANVTTYAWDAISVVSEHVGNWDRYFEANERAQALDIGNTSVLEGRVRVEEFRGNHDYVDQMLEEMTVRLPNLHGMFDRVNTAFSYMHTFDRKPSNAEIALDILESVPPAPDAPRRQLIQTNLLLGLSASELGLSERLHEILNWFESTPGTDRADPFVNAYLSRLLTAVDRHDEAIAHARQFLERFRETRFSVHAYAALWTARALIARGNVEDLDEARNLLDTAEEISKELSLNGLLSSISSTRQNLETARSGATRADGLTTRELEILAMVSAGKSNPEIADELFISRHTVVRHTSNIFGKIGVANRAQATEYAREHNITL